MLHDDRRHVEHQVPVPNGRRATDWQFAAQRWVSESLARERATARPFHETLFDILFARQGQQHGPQRQG